MRHFILPLCIATLAACGPNQNNYVPPEEADAPLSDVSAIFDGVPDNSTLPDDNKADAVYPAKFDLVADQSLVKSQGRRGTCTIFAAAGLMENLYIKAGETEPDFSEQYLQWSVKTEVGSFPTSGGSNARSNLSAINRYGIVVEELWPYEASGWGTAEDEACTGDNQPTRCHTNGDPPQAALDGEKFTLPRGRWVNTNSIKAHMTSKNQAVVIGVEFFYQSWNHRRSELPTNQTYWREGYVTEPNADDLRVSRESPAGHGILLVGWDDNLEVSKRDGEGELIVDADGNPEKEKGFYVFKNSWGRDSFGIDNEHGAGFGFISFAYVERFATAYASDLPDVGTPVEICDDGADNDGNGDADCDDAACASTQACQPVGPTPLDYSSNPGTAIPDNDPNGIEDTITVTDTGLVEGLSVQVAITHTYQGDLEVALEHGQTIAILHDRTGGGNNDLNQTYSLSDFDGQDLSGDWRLLVSDYSAVDTGTLDSWSLQIVPAP